MSNILDYGKENVLEFIQTTIKTNNNVKHDILDKIKYVLGEVIEGGFNEDYSSQGFYYERLWDLCIKFGATNLTLPAIKGKLQTSHIINENPNKTDIEFQSNCWNGNKLDQYLLQPVRSGNSGGYSDITFFNKTYDDKGSEIGEELYFISVKYFKEEKEISKYDIGKLCSLIKEHEKKNRIIKLYIFVRDKKNAVDKFNAQHSSSNILIKYINPGGNYEHIYDINDLQVAFFKLKKILEQYDYLLSPSNIIDFQTNYLNVLKDVFIPRFHQELFILKINKLIEHGEKNILVGAIPRSGKSYIMAGSILEYVKKQEELHPGKKVKILLITPAPNETFGEYKAIFNKYIEFDKLGIDVVTYEDGVNSKKVCKNKDKHCVIIISKQKLGWTAGSHAEKILAKDDEEMGDDVDDEDENEAEAEDKEVEDKEDKDIKSIKQRIIKLFDANPDIDIMFLDEAHFGMSTEKAQQIVKVLDSVVSNTIKIYVTATYNKPLQAYGVKADCKITWHMNDIQIMQKIDKETINDNSIQKQFGNDIYEKALEYFGDKTGISLIDKFKKDYAIFPKPYLITSVWDKEFLNVEKLKIGDTEFGWDMNKLFATIDDSDNFANEEQIKEMMRYYFGYPDKKEDYDKQSFYRTRGILPRIRNICLNKCRTLQPQHKTTQLWFLPLGNGKIKNKTKALINLLTNSNEFKDVKQNYHFFIAVDIEDKTKKGRTINGVTYMGNPHHIKADIENVEKLIKEGTRKEYKQDNLIILAGQRLQLGISLRNVDIVTLWNSISSADAIFQMLFRSMTEIDVPSCKEKPNEYCDEKKFGFMVDMNPQRALTNVSLFTANISKKKDEGDIQKYRQITDLINIDEDVLFDKYGDNEKSRNDFVKDLFNKLYASWDINVENIKKIIGKFTFDMTKLEALKKAFEQINIEKNKKKKDEIDGKEDDEMIEPGKKKEKLVPNKKKDKKESKEKEINLIETATELISEFISLLNIFTLYADKGAQCILTDSSKLNAQISVIDDIDDLKSSVYQDEETKDVFLKILNGRLSGNADEPYPEKIIEDVLEAMNNLDDKQIVNKIIMSQKKQYYTINEPDKLLEFINGELKPKEKEKKENGEVFTPLSLVNEMLDNLDESYTKEYRKSIFTQDGFKWLDPAVGIGNFPIIVYQRLMKGLETQIPNEEERRKHILEQMIYASELTPKNVFIYNKIFCGEKYKLNIYQGDSLKMDVKQVFHLPADFIGFDVVMGNPPYNANGTKHKGDKNIYVYFSKLALNNWLKSNGYLLFIHPPVYRIPNHKIQHTQTNLNEIYTTKKILCIKMYSISETHTLMHVMINVDFIIIQNSPNDLLSKSKIIDVQGSEYEIQIKPNDFIPNFGLNIMTKIREKYQDGNIELKLDSEMHAQKTTGSKYKNIHGIILNGVKICMSDKKHKYFDIPKLIINGIGSYNYTFYDKKGEYGITQSPIGIINPSENTLQFIQSSLFHYIANSTKIIGNNFNIKTSLFLPIIPKDIKIKSVNDLYKYFGFSLDEISKINSFSIPTYKDQQLSCDGKTLLNGNTIPNIKHQIVKEQETEEDVEEDVEEDEEEIENEEKQDEEVKPKKSPIKLDKKIVLVPATEEEEYIPIPIPLKSSIPKKKRTLKKRPKSILVESSGENKIVYEKPLEPNTDNFLRLEPSLRGEYNHQTSTLTASSPFSSNIFNPSTNLKKIEKQTLKSGGKSTKKTRKNKGNRILH
jgi:hypothetical protein